jgi:hypothetical protein
MLTVTKSRDQLRYIQVIFTLLKWNEKNPDFMAIRETKKSAKNAIGTERIAISAAFK